METTMSDRMDEIRTRVEAATEVPAPWYASAAPAGFSNEAKAEYMAGAITEHGPLWIVWKPDDEGDSYRVPAITGDGPNGEALAQFIAHAREDIPWLLERLEAVRELHAETTCEEDCCGASPCCSECGPGFEWPCPTIKAMDGDA